MDWKYFVAKFYPGNKVVFYHLGRILFHHVSCLGADSTSCDSILGYCPNFGHISNKFERNGAVTTFTAFMATG